MRPTTSLQRAMPQSAASVLTALREAVFGNIVEARLYAKLAHRLSTGKRAHYGTALALALAGDEAQAQALADDLGRRFPNDTWFSSIICQPFALKLR